MQLNNLPARIQEAFAVNGQRNAIPVPSQASTTPGAASFNDGFPSTTMQPISSGGVPPSGKDMNGILYAITLIQQWQSGGGQFQYDSAWSSANGGYPKGAILLSADGLNLWQNTVDGNTTNPDATDGSAANWVALSTSGMTSVTGLTNANITLTPAQWGKPVIAFSGTLTGNVQIVLPTIAGMRWSVANNTTGVYTLTVKTAGGSGVVVTQGQAQQVYCDGTNIQSIGMTQAQADARYYQKGGAIDGSPVGQSTPAPVTGTALKGTQGLSVTGSVTSTPNGTAIFDRTNDQVRIFGAKAADGSAAVVNINWNGGLTYLGGRLVTNGATDTGDGNVLGGTAYIGGALTIGAGHINLANGYYLNTKNTSGTVVPMLGMDNGNVTRLYANNIDSLDFDASGNGTFAKAVVAPAGTSGNQVVNFSQFGSTLAASGYQKLPSGLIIQWGTFTAATTGVTVAFPIAFPTACYSVIPSAPTANNAWADADIVDTQHATIKTWNTAGPIATSGTYFAIGK